MEVAIGCYLVFLFLSWRTKERNMIRLIAVAFTLALTSSTQAMPVQPQQQPDEMVTLVR